MKPLVSIIMPVYNAEKYLEEAIESILNQTYTHFEFLIFNDGSTDRSKKIIANYDDDRIKLIHHNKNLGYVQHLNNGINLAKGKYIARMDADDISMPERLEKQVDFLEKFEDIAILGTNAKFMVGNKKTRYKSDNPLSNSEIKPYMIFYIPFLHPSIMVRKDVLKNYKYKSNHIVEDYQLWLEILHNHKGANLKENLIWYRRHETNYTKVNSDKYKKDMKDIFKQILQNNQIPYDDIDMKNLLLISESNMSLNFSQLMSIKPTLLKFLSLNHKYVFFDLKRFATTISIVWERACIKTNFSSLREVITASYTLLLFSKNNIITFIKMYVRYFYHKLRKSNN